METGKMRFPAPKSIPKNMEDTNMISFMLFFFIYFPCIKKGNFFISFSLADSRRKRKAKPKLYNTEPRAAEPLNREPLKSISWKPFFAYLQKIHLSFPTFYRWILDRRIIADRFVSEKKKSRDLCVIPPIH